MRRRLPWWLLLVAFVVVPLVEIYVIIQVGQVIGAWWTIGLLVADSIIGAWLVKREGSRAWQALRVALAQGRMPSRELADGVLIVVGGTLMVTPGFVSDVVGTLLVLPVARPLGRRVLAGLIGRRLLGGAVTRRGPGTRPGNDSRPGPDVVQGEVVD
ncbi:MAG TPA: FxsA family protein [Marmoricola sp.]|nr:FxsA family protein [Marmoricola sp.]